MAPNDRDTTTDSYPNQRAAEALDAIRDTEIQTLRQIEGVGATLAARLLDELGSLAGVATPRTFGTTLDAVEGIGEDMARAFPDRLSEGDIPTDLRCFDSDAARRAKYADMARRVNGEFAGWLEITEVHQLVTGVPMPALRVVFEPTDEGVDESVYTTFPQGTQPYTALLDELGVSARYRKAPPDEIRWLHAADWQGRTVPFRYEQAGGLILTLDGGEYRV